MGTGGIGAFLNQYELSREESVVLMCLAEALLRIPDADTRDELIKDKIGGAQWECHLGASSSLFVNASTWALMLTGRLVLVGTGFDFRKTKFNKLAGRKSCSSSYHEVVGLGMLEHQPHCFDIFRGVTPVPLCRQIAKSQNILFFSDNLGDALTDFFRDKILPPAW